MSFACVECGCTKRCVPIDGPNGITCDICYGVMREQAGSPCAPGAPPGSFSLVPSSGFVWGERPVPTLVYACSACMRAFRTQPEFNEHWQEKHVGKV